MKETKSFVWTLPMFCNNEIIGSYFCSFGSISEQTNTPTNTPTNEQINKRNKNNNNNHKNRTKTLIRDYHISNIKVGFSPLMLRVHGDCVIITFRTC